MYENFCFAVNLVKHANKKVDSCLNFQICDLPRNSIFGTFGRVSVPQRLNNQSLHKEILQKFNDIGRF